MKGCCSQRIGIVNVHYLPAILSASLHVFVCLSVFLFTYLSVCPIVYIFRLSACLSIYLLVCFHVCVFVCLFVCLSNNLYVFFVRPSNCLSIYMPVYLIVNLSVQLSICTFFYQ